MVPFVQIRGGVENPEIKLEQDVISGVKGQSELGFGW